MPPRTRRAETTDDNTTETQNQTTDVQDTDADGNDQPEPQPVAPQTVDVVPEPEEETGDADALRYDADRVGSPEPYVHKRWPNAARGNIASQLLKAAETLGYPADVVRSTSDGYRYPQNIDRYLFPSEYR